MSSFTQPDLSRPNSETIKSLFDAVSARYDFLNSLLSFGLDAHWRGRIVERALDGIESSILDLGVGTGKSLSAFLKRHRFERAVGCDFSLAMLERAGRRLGSRAAFLSCDFHELPFPAGSFDLVTGSFILRSVQNLEVFFREVKRVLSPGGKAVFLELTRPSSRFFWNWVYKPYLRIYIPCVGRLVSRHEGAYRFLSESIQNFPEPAHLKETMKSAGFSDAASEPLSFGIASLIRGS